jgi:hypothetical protein
MDVCYNKSKSIKKEGVFMLQELLQQNIFIYAIVGIGVLNVISNFILHGRYRTLLFAAENMSLTDEKILKSIRSKFEDTYRRNMKINDISSFIHKNMYKEKFLGMTYSFWNKMNQQALLVIGGIATVGSLILRTGSGNAEVWKTLGVAAMTAICVELVDIWMGNSQLWFMVHTNLEYFLANFLQNKYEQEISEEKGRSVERDMDYLRTCISEIASTREQGAKGLNEKEIGIVEDILNEFFA